MPFTFKLSNRLALMKASLAAGAILTLACTSDLTDPQLHRSSSTAVAIAADLAPLAATTVVASAYQDANVPQNTLDGNLATRWSANGDGQWIRYDLGSTMTIGSITIAWYQGTSWQSAFELHVSLDGATWSPVFTGRSSGRTLHPERYDFPAVPARYVRIVGHGRWNSITEVAIYASNTGTGTPAPVATVSVSPASLSIAVSQTMQLTATPRDAAGHALTGRTVTWKTSNGAVATVSATGLATGVSAGTATITATSEGVTGTATSTMTAP